MSKKIPLFVPCSFINSKQYKVLECLRNYIHLWHILHMIPLVSTWSLLQAVSERYAICDLTSPAVQILLFRKVYILKETRFKNWLILDSLNWISSSVVSFYTSRICKPLAPKPELFSYIPYRYTVYNSCNWQRVSIYSEITHTYNLTSPFLYCVQQWSSLLYFLMLCITVVTWGHKNVQIFLWKLLHLVLFLCCDFWKVLSNWWILAMFPLQNLQHTRVSCVAFWCNKIPFSY